MSDKSPIDKAAELFTSLSHPLRISIIKVVHEKGPVSFSGLMKALNVDSGTLGFHLKQLEPYLIRDENGNYGLSDAGKAALPILQSLGLVELKGDEKKERKMKEARATIDWIMEPEKRRQYLRRVTLEPGNWSIGIGVFLTFIGLFLFVWSPGIFSVVIITLGIAGVCVGCWINYKETRTIWELTKEKES